MASLKQTLKSKSQFTKWLILNEVCERRFPRTFKVDECKQKWKGKTVIVTGVTRGIGLLILKKLLQLEMKVVIGCRNPLICQEILLSIQQSDNVDISQTIIYELDFMSLKSVRNFVDQIKNSKIPVHLLINNARIIGGQFTETIDGFETHFQANCLSPFLLINLLLPIMKETSKEFGSPVGRIVNVCSALMCLGKIDFDDMEQRKNYNSLQAYFNSQLLQILLLRQLFTNLHQEEEEEAIRINIYAVHPGVTASELPNRKISRLFMKPFLTAKEDGANQVLYIALSSNLDSTSGEFFIHPNDNNNNTGLNCCGHTSSRISKNEIAFVGNQQLQEKVWNMAKYFTINKNEVKAKDMMVFYSIVDSEL